MNGLFSWAVLADIEQHEKTTVRDLLTRLSKTLGRDVSIAQLYTTLTRLKKEGFLITETQPPTKVRGGRARSLYSLTDDGKWQVFKHRAIFSCHSVARAACSLT